MQNESTPPVTVISGKSICIISCQGKVIPWPGSSPGNNFWLVVLSAKDLSVVANEICNGQSTDVPAAVKKYDGSKEHILLVSTIALNSAMVPKGDLLTFLMNNGYRANLARAIQLCTIMDYTTSFFNYASVGMMGGEAEGFDAYSVSQHEPLSLPLRFELVGASYMPVNEYP